MSDDRFGKPVIFSTGVHWNPTDYKSIDQTPYLAYLDKEDYKVRTQQGLYTEEEVRVFLGVRESSREIQGS